MYSAGSVVAVLGGVVEEAPFSRYATLVSTTKARVKDGVRVILGADDQAAGPLERFGGLLRGARDQADVTAASVKKSFGTIDKAAADSAAATDASVGKIRRSYDSLIGKIGQVVESQKALRASAAETAARMDESAMAGSAGGGGPRRPSFRQAFASGFGKESEDQAKKTTSAWKTGFHTLAGLGKWVTVGMLGVGAISVKMAADFQKQMELVHTQAGYSQREVDNLSKSLLRLAPAVGIGPTKLAEGLFHIASSGIPAGKALNILTLAAKGARVGNAQLEDVTNALVAVMRTAPKDIHSVAEAMGVMNDVVGQGNMRMPELVGALSTGILPAAKAVGLGLRDVGAALDVMTARGVPAQEGATRLRTVLGLIANPTAKAQAALDQLGFSGDRLATDFRKKGLVGALDDLQAAMRRTFGHKLTTAEEERALTDYATQLKNAGTSASTAQKDLVKFKHQLDSNGSGAIRASQLIASAFGGARMGTTMQILMQNVDDVKKHFDNLNRAGAAQRFDAAWRATQKDFSQQAAELGGSIQKLGIQIGDWLIPKVKDMVNWLIEAGKWMGKHKELADALAVTFGTLLTAAVMAFFARFIGRTFQGIAAIGRFGKAIYDLPKSFKSVMDKMAANWEEQRKQIDETKTSVEELGATADGVHMPGMAGGVGGVAGEAMPQEEPALHVLSGMGGAIEGMIVGYRSSTMMPGSAENPLAVVVMAGERYGLGSRGSASESVGAGEAAASTTRQGAGGVQETVVGKESTTMPVTGKATSVSGSGLVVPGSLESRSFLASQASLQAAEAKLRNSLVMEAGSVGDVFTKGILPPNASAEVQQAYIDYQTALGKSQGALDELVGVTDEAVKAVQAEAAAAARAAAAADALAAEEEATRIGPYTPAEITSMQPREASRTPTPVMAPGSSPQEIGAVPGEAALAGEAGLVGGAGMMAPSRGGGVAGFMRGVGRVGGRIMGGLGIAGMGVMGAQMAGSMIGGSTGSTVSTVGSLAAGGAGLGSMISPVLGTALGAGLGAAAGLALSLFGHDKSYGTKIADSMTYGFGTTASKQISKGIQQSLDDAKKLTDSTAPRHVFAGIGSQIIAGARLSPAQQQQLANDYANAGRMLVKALEKGWSGYTVLSEPVMFQQFAKDAKHLPKQAAAAAGDALIEFSKKMEDQGKLPVGATKKLLAQIQAQFPGFQSFMGHQGVLTWKNFQQDDQAKNLEKSIQGHIDTISGQFQGLGQDLKGQEGNMQGQWHTTFELMLHDSHSHVSNIRDAALTGLKQMVTDAQKELPVLPQIMGTESAQQRTLLINNLSQAIDGVRDLMKRGAIHTHDGMVAINKLLSGELHALDVNVAAPIQQLAGKLDPIKLFGGTSLASSPTTSIPSSVNRQPVHASGGVLPGAEYGLGDLMTLVDPQGHAVAKMAGDEAIFNRHQMPYVDAGLQMLGFAGGAKDLWQTVDKPHYAYASGGQLARGGYTGYSLPLPRGSMMPGSWSLDQGVDIPAGAGTPEFAIGPGVITQEGISGFGPNAPILRVTSGPLAGMSFYYGHSGPDLVRVGQHVRAGQQITEVGAGIVGISSGPHIEFGIWPPRGGGATVAPLLRQLMGNAGVSGIPGGGGAGGGSWSPLHAPKSGMKGPLGSIVQAVLNKATSAANRFGEAHAPTGLGAAGVTGSAAGAAVPVGNIMKIAQIAAQAAGVPWDSAIVRELLSKESSGGENLPPHVFDAVHDPAGPFQVIGSTFAAFEAPGHTNRMNPLDNALAAFRYIKATYRTLANLAARTGLFGSGYKGYARGGRLPGFAGGGRPYPPLPSGTGYMPGYRPVRVRRGRGGLHTVGGGPKGHSIISVSGKGAHAPKSVSRAKQPLSSKVAGYLKEIGLPDLTTDQSTLGQLDDLYTRQSDVYGLYQGSSTGMTLGELNTLQEIREAEWGLLFHEYTVLPSAIIYLQKHIKSLSGKSARTQKTTVGGARVTEPRAHGRHSGSGVLGLASDINDDTIEIQQLENQLALDQQRVAKDKHNITAKAMDLASRYAGSLSGYHDELNAIASQQITLSRKRQELQHSKVKSTPSSSSTGGWSVASLVGQVMAGSGSTPLPKPATTVNNRIDDAIYLLRLRSDGLQKTAHDLHVGLQHIQDQKQAASRALRKEGFDEAWAIQLERFKISDKIRALRTTLTQLKAELKKEEATLAAYGASYDPATGKVITTSGGTLETLQQWLGGNTQGQESVVQSLGDIGYDLLDLQSQGANLPTPLPYLNRDSLVTGILKKRGLPAQKNITDILKKLGVTLPPGMASPAQTAAGEAFDLFAQFQADRQSMLTQFGSNFVGAGVNPYTSSAGIGAGRQYYGAAAGPNPGAGAMSQGGMLGGPHVNSPGATTNTYNFTNHYAVGPPNPHTYAAGVSSELRALI